MVRSGHGITSAEARGGAGHHGYGVSGARHALTRSQALIAASAATRATSQDWGSVARKDADRTAEWGEQERRGAASGHRHSQVPDKDGRRPHHWDRQEAQAISESHHDNRPPAKDIERGSGHKDSKKYHVDQAQADAIYRPSTSLDLGAQYTIPGAEVVDFALESASMILATPTRAIDAHSDTQTWQSNQATGLQTRHPWDGVEPRFARSSFKHEVEPNPDPIEPDPPDPPPDRRSYLYVNSSSLVTLPGLMPLEFADLSIRLDLDSFSWAMTCTLLNEASLDLVKPTPEGPAEVRATVNGHQWVFMVERYSVDRRFAKERYTINCVGRTQMLARPYAPEYSGSNGSPQTLSQAMNSRLDLSGFVVEYPQGMPDPTLPAGAHEYTDKTPIDIVSDLAKSIGAAIVPARDSDTLRIRHRYKMIGPWAYPTQPENTLDAIISDSIIIGYSSEWHPGQEYNGVHVSGLTKGIACTVIRQGTAGDRAAPDDFSDLTVDPGQARLKGLTLLAASGNYEIVTIETPLPTSGPPGLIEPAMLIEYRHGRDASRNWRGVVLENQISVKQPGSGRVIQTIQVERHHYEA